MRSRTAEPARPRTPAARAADAALVVVAVLGGLVLLGRLLGALLGLQLVTFATGSMTPAYPQGAVALAQRAPLADVRVGDVVTVDRPGRLPITHRVVAIRVTGDRAVVRLRGDANRRADPAPYRVTALSRVLVPLPGPVGLWGRPEVALAGVLLAALAVGWALWPQSPRPSAARPAPA